jgi:hypothetical protein
MMRQRLEHELNPPTWNPVTTSLAEARETKECSSSSSSSTTTTTTTSSIKSSLSSQLSVAADDSTAKMLRRNKQLQEQLMLSCTSALELEREADTYSVGHPARKTSYRVAAGAYNMVLLQIDDSRCSIEKLLEGLSVVATLSSSGNSSSRVCDDMASETTNHRQVVIAEKKSQLSKLQTVSTYYHERAESLGEKIKQMETEERMNKKTDSKENDEDSYKSEASWSSAYGQVYNSDHK